MFCLNKNKNDEKLFCLHTKKLNGKKAKCKNEKGKCFSHFPWSVHFSKTFRYLPIPLPILFPKAPANGKIHAICIPLNETNKWQQLDLQLRDLWFAHFENCCCYHELFIFVFSKFAICSLCCEKKNLCKCKYKFNWNKRELIQMNFLIFLKFKT